MQRVLASRAPTASETLARRAVSCSVSSAFHVRGAPPAFARARDLAYGWLVLPAVAALGGAALLRLWLR